MAETDEDITPEIRGITLSDREILLHLLQHVEDQHDLLMAMSEELTDARAKVIEMHAELESAKPLLEKWTHSKLVKLAAGQFPWTQNATGGNHD